MRSRAAILVGFVVVVAAVTVSVNLFEGASSWEDEMEIEIPDRVRRLAGNDLVIGRPFSVHHPGFGLEIPRHLASTDVYWFPLMNLDEVVRVALVHHPRPSGLICGVGEFAELEACKLAVELRKHHLNQQYSLALVRVRGYETFAVFHRDGEVAYIAPVTAAARNRLPDWPGSSEPLPYDDAVFLLSAKK